MIEITALMELVVVMIALSLILAHWQPPVPKGQQGLICLVLGGIMGYLFAGFSYDGIMTGLIAASVSYWRGELFKVFNEVRDEATDLVSSTKKK